MKIGIVGIGGVGGYYGGKMAKRYEGSGAHEVFFVARGEHLARIKDKGLTVKTREEEFIAHPARATDDPAELGPLDLIIFAVKGYGLNHAAKLLAGNVRKNTVSIPLLNGVDNVHILKEILPESIILNGCVYISSRIQEPGIIEQIGGSCKLVFGPEDGNLDPFNNIEKLLLEAEINAELSKNIGLDAWTKYIFISPLASLCAEREKTLGELMEDENDRLTLEGMMREVEQLGRRLKIPFPPDIVEKSLDMTSNFPYETKTSLHVDFEKGNDVEIEAFAGYVVRKGQTLGIDTPLHGQVYESLMNKLRK